MEEQRQNEEERLNEIAQSHGFRSCAELRTASTPLRIKNGNGGEWFVAQDREGRWFVWCDEEHCSTADPSVEEHRGT